MTLVHTEVIAAALVCAACSSVRPLTPTPTPLSIQQYVVRHPHSDLRVSDSLGRSRWIHNVEVHGDTLRGIRDPSLPRDRIAIPLTEITQLAVSQFSAGRTVALIGGVAAVAGVWAVMLPS